MMQILYMEKLEVLFFLIFHVFLTLSAFGLLGERSFECHVFLGVIKEDKTHGWTVAWARKQLPKMEKNMKVTFRPQAASM